MDVETRENINIKVVKYRYKKLKREQRDRKMHECIEWIKEHPLMVAAKIGAFIELVFVHRHLYGWCMTAEDRNMVHLLGLTFFLVLIATRKQLEKFEI